MSIFGTWSSEDGLPVFEYTADPRVGGAVEWDTALHGRTARHWVGIGNRRLQVFVDNEGTCGLWDEHDGLRWLTSSEGAGTGVSVVEAGGVRWATDAARWPSGEPPVRRMGPTWFTVTASHGGLAVERTTFCLEGEHPWVLVRVTLTELGGVRRPVTLTEEWVLRPRFVQLSTTREQRAATARRAVAHERAGAGSGAARRVVVRERFVGGTELAPGGQPPVFGAPRTFVLEVLGHHPSATTGLGDDPDPIVHVTVPLELGPGQRTEIWFRFGLHDGSALADPPVAVAASMAGLRRRLPVAAAPLGPDAARELPWHAALLTGGACRDGVLGGHTLDQSSTYSMELGFNGAARDPYQHALPLVYLEPDLALSVLRNTCAWGDRNGRVPWGIDGAKRPWNELFDPSDQPLWAMWLAAEYAAATGDLGAFGEDLALPWDDADPPRPLYEQLRRQFRYFVDVVGRGEHGHVRIMNADWNDMAIVECGVPRPAMVRSGESVLNSAMAAWVLPVWAGLADRLGDPATAAEARALGTELRDLVATEWNGRWFRRAYGPGAPPVGDDDLWLEVQPWAILCGAADPEQARQLLRTIDRTARQGSPLGARVKWPPPADDGNRLVGESTMGGIWYAINMTLVWAAARLEPELAWDEWRRMTLAAHETAYPGIWEGTLSGPDAYNAPESARPGRTWARRQGGIAMQAFPVNNLHSHAQPLLAYLRILGVEPTPEGDLRVGSGAAFAGDTFGVDAEGHGRVRAKGPVTVRSVHGTATGGPGEVAW